MSKPASVRSNNSLSRSKPSSISGAAEAEEVAGDHVEVETQEIPVGEGSEGVDQGESGKFRQLLGILRKAINVKDLSGMRISLPGNLMEPIGNLEAWQYADRPDVFATMGQSEDHLERMLAVLRWTFTKDLKFTKHKIVKPYNSILGEHFHCHWDVVAPTFDAQTGELLIRHHLDLSPSSDILIAAGRSSTTVLTAPSSPALEDILAATTLNSSSASSVSSIGGGGGTTTVASSHTAHTTDHGNVNEEEGNTRVVFLNEQTSHHPPISNFRIEARGPAGRVSAVGADQLSAKFTGTTVKVYPGPHNFGIFVKLHDRDEEYHITHATATIAGLIRASPYVTIGEQSTITCRSISGLTKKPVVESTEESVDEAEEAERGSTLKCIIAYAEESWLMRPRFLLTGVIYRVDSEDEDEITKIKHVPADQIVATFEGNWRGEIKWKKVDDKVFKPLIDLLPLRVVPKSVAPLEEQLSTETRKVWEEVTNYLLAKEYSLATKAKQTLEQLQRTKADARKANKEEYVPTYFEVEGESWDGRPVLTKAGEEAIEIQFKAKYEVNDPNIIDE